MTEKAAHIDLKQSSIVPPESTAGLGRIYTLDDDIMYAEINGSVPYPIAFRLVSGYGRDYSQLQLDSAPPGWDSTSSADVVSVGLRYFNIAVEGTATSWTYDFQLDLPFSTAADNGGRYTLFVGPCVMQVKQPASNQDIYIAIHPDNAGAADTNKYVRLHMQWDNTGGVWQWRGEQHDGTTPYDGTWNTIALPGEPFFVTLSLWRNSSAMDRGQVRVGYTRDVQSGQEIQSQALVFTPGTPWLRLSAANLPTTNTTFRVGAFDLFFDDEGNW